MDELKITKRRASRIREVAGCVLESIPMTFSITDLSPGRRVYFPIPMMKNPKEMSDFLYVYAESKLTDIPKNEKIGFTEADISDEVGIYVFAKDGDCISGNTYSIEDFLLNVDIDLSLRNRIIYRVNEMRNMVHLDESFLDIANKEWDTHHNPASFTKRLH
jgi:hypothetical protein